MIRDDKIQNKRHDFSLTSKANLGKEKEKEKKYDIFSYKIGFYVEN